MVISSVPPAGAVRVSPDRLRIEFSEYVNRPSFESAVRIAPAFDAPLAFNWGRGAVEILFPAPLRENTTYRVTIETGFQDVHGVALSRPLTIAFATGPRIQHGRIEGVVTEAATGLPAAEIPVYAYADLPADTLPPRPSYRTQTAPDGSFLFTYLPEQPFYVIALGDDNRNRRRDLNEAYAVPPQPGIAADTSTTTTLSQWWLGLPENGIIPLDSTEMQADTTDTTRISPEEMGGIGGVVAHDSPAPVVVQLFTGKGDSLRLVRTAVTDPAGNFLFHNLPEDPYRLRAFIDADGDSTWDVGRLAPYAPNEPVAWWADSLRVRPRWDTMLADTLSFERP